MSAAAAPAPPGEAPIPWLGLIAVLLGTFISTLTGRLSTFGLTDMRGALHAGFDEGAWVLANYKETQLGPMLPGQRVAITVDAIPRHTFYGWVDSFSPGSGTIFALLPSDNATGNFTKIVQRIAVKIAITDTDGLTGRLRAGMSAIPRIDTTLPDGSRP